MTSLLTLSPIPGSYETAAYPHAYEQAGREQFRGMPGVRWVPDKKAPNGRGYWCGDAGAIEIVAATLEAAGVCKVKGHKPQLQEGEAFETIHGIELDSHLRDYQREGAAWIRWQLSHSDAALLADEMGLGKTAQAIAAIPEDARTVVVCPAVVVANWRREVANWGRDQANFEVMSYDAAVIALSDKPRKLPAKPTKAQRERAEEISRQRAALAACTHIVLDEIHYLSSSKSQRSKAIREWRGRRLEVQAIGLSGTPMTTRPRDLWHVLEVLWPGRFGSWWDFTRRYAGGHFCEITNSSGARVTNESGEPLKPVWNSEGISRPEELRTRLAHCMLRRTKAQVGAELPPRTRVIHEVTIAAAARRGAKEAAIALAANGGGEGVTRLLAYAEGYKLDAAEALARDVMACGSRPLILTTRKKSARDLAARLGAPCVTGEIAADAREAMLQDAPAGCATMYAVEVGINLVGYDVIIFVGLDWVPSKILQAESRIHRIGQDKPCTIYYLIARGTADEIIQQRVIERLDNFAKITGAAGDELGLAHDLNPDTEEDLIAAIVAAAKGEAT